MGSYFLIGHLKFENFWVKWYLARLVVMNKNHRVVQWEWTLYSKYVGEFWFSNQHIWDPRWDPHTSDHLKIKRSFILTHCNFCISTSVMKLEMAIFMIGSCVLDEMIWFHRQIVCGVGSVHNRVTYLGLGSTHLMPTLADACTRGSFICIWDVVPKSQGLGFPKARKTLS